jgi:ABC-type phosphate transport system substrate-binding protein
VCADRGIPAEELYQQTGANFTQFPLVGQAIVMAYNLSTLNSTDPNLVKNHKCPYWK